MSKSNAPDGPEDPGGPTSLLYDHGNSSVTSSDRVVPRAPAADTHSPRGGSPPSRAEPEPSEQQASVSSLTAPPKAAADLTNRYLVLSLSIKAEAHSDGTPALVSVASVPKSLEEQPHDYPRDRVAHAMHRPIDYPSDSAEDWAEPLIKAPTAAAPASQSQAASDSNDVPDKAHSPSSESCIGSQAMNPSSSCESPRGPHSSNEVRTTPAYHEQKLDGPSFRTPQALQQSSSSAVLPIASSPQDLAQKATPQSTPQLLLLPLPPQPQPIASQSQSHPGAQPSIGKKRPRPTNAAASTPKKPRRGGSAAATAAEPPSFDGGSPSSSSASASASSPLLSAGRWTAEEHRAFLSGLATYGREWKRVALHIPTRTSSQVRSHAQKYFTKLQQLQQQQQHQHHQAGSSSDPSGALEFPGGAAGFLMDPSLTFSGAPPFTQGLDPALSGALSSSGDATGDEALPPSVQANVERILAQPETVQAEVDDTLLRLRERYRHLQHRLRQRQQQQQQLQARRRRGDRDDPQEGGGGADEQDQASLHSAMSLEVESVCNSLQDSELIALHVLQGGLEHQSTAPSASSASSSPSNDTSTLTNTVGNSHVHADVGPTGPGLNNLPNEQQGPEADEKMQQAHLQEPEVEEEERPNPQDPPSANPYS
jgi:SHAQKYF class myb-like DNA-binding protein